MSNITWTYVGLIILSFLLPPLAVFIRAEDFNKDFVINCLLSIFGWVPGTLHAIYYITTYEDDDPLRDVLV